MKLFPCTAHGKCPGSTACSRSAAGPRWSRGHARSWSGDGRIATTGWCPRDSGLSNARRINDTAAAVRSDGLAVSALACDLAKRGQFERLVERTFSRDEGFDVLVNDAGVSSTHLALGCPDDAWRRTLAVSIEAPFQLAWRLAPRMKHSGDRSIINITSINGELSFLDNPATRRPRERSAS